MAEGKYRGRTVDRDVLDAAVDDVASGVSPDEVESNMGAEADAEVPFESVRFSQVASMLRRAGRSAVRGAVAFSDGVYDAAAKRVDAFNKAHDVRGKVDEFASEHSSLDYAKRSVGRAMDGAKRAGQLIFGRRGLGSTVAGIGTLGASAVGLVGRGVVGGLSALYRGAPHIGRFFGEVRDRVASEIIADGYERDAAERLGEYGVAESDRLGLTAVEYRAGRAGVPVHEFVVGELVDQMRDVAPDYDDDMVRESAEAAYVAVERDLAREHGFEGDVEGWREIMDDHIRSQMGSDYGADAQREAASDAFDDEPTPDAPDHGELEAEPAELFDDEALRESRLRSVRGGMVESGMPDHIRDAVEQEVASGALDADEAKAWRELVSTMGRTSAIGSVLQHVTEIMERNGTMPTIGDEVKTVADVVSSSATGEPEAEDAAQEASVEVMASRVSELNQGMPGYIRDLAEQADLEPFEVAAGIWGDEGLWYGDTSSIEGMFDTDAFSEVMEDARSRDEVAEKLGPWFEAKARPWKADELVRIDIDDGDATRSFDFTPEEVVAASVGEQVRDLPLGGMSGLARSLYAHDMTSTGSDATGTLDAPTLEISEQLRDEIATKLSPEDLQRAKAQLHEVAHDKEKFDTFCLCMERSELAANLVSAKDWMPRQKSLDTVAMAAGMSSAGAAYEASGADVATHAGGVQVSLASEAVMDDDEIAF